MADNVVIIQYEGDFNKLKGQLESFKNTNEKTAKDLGDSFSGALVGKFAAIAAGILSISAAFKTLGSAIGEAIESENAINKLSNSLRVAGTFSVDAVSRIEDFANEIQRTTTLTDDLTISLVSLARNFARTNEQAIKLTEAGINLAARLGIDQETAVRALGQSLDGTAGRLNELLPELKNFTAEQLKNGAAIDFVAKRYGDFAKGEAKTFGGAIIQLRNNFDNFLEELGNSIIKVPEFRTIIASLKETFVELAAAVKSANFGQVISDSIGPLLSTVSFVAEAFSVLFNGIKVGVFSILEAFTAVFGAIVEIVDATAGRFIRFVGLFPGFADQLTNFKDFVLQTQADLSKQNDFAFLKLQNQDTNSVSAFVDKLKADIEASRSNVNEAGKDLGNEFGKGVTSSLQQLDLAPLLSNVFIKSLEGVGTLLVDLFKDPQAGIKKFAATILNILGDLAIQIGTFIITTSAAFAAFKAALTGLGPVGLGIAAGVGLVVLGGALKGLAGILGGGSSASASASGGGASASTPSGGGATVSSDEVANTQAQPSTEVTVNIQGNVLDRKETGLFIAETLQEQFNSQGGVINTAFV